MAELVDREAALEALGAALARARDGAGQVVAVSGEPGIGKSTLVHHFVAGLPPTVRVLEGVCDDLLTPRPLAPFHDVARRTGGELAELLRAGAGPDRVHQGLVDLLARTPPPTVLVLEDLHWADEATLDVLTLLGRRVGEHGVLVVTTHRDGEVGPDHRLTRVLASVPTAHLTPVALSPLSPAAVATLAGARDVDADRLHVLTGGNPFYVTEVLAGDGRSLPPSVGFAVTARLATLPAPTQQLLRVMALVPTRVDTDLLDRLAPDWAELLAPAETTGMVELDGIALRFRHELARHAVAQTTSPMLARRHHADILAALADLDVDAARLVHHAEGAGDVAAMARHARQAAHDAHRAEAHREAVAHYERALQDDALPDEAAAELWFGLARARMAADLSERDTLAAATRAAELARGLGDDRRLGRALANQSRIASWAGDNRLAAAVAEEAVAVLSDAAGSAELAEAMLAVVYVRLAYWRFEEAVTWSRRALATAEEAGDPALAALARTYLGVVETGATGETERLIAGIRGSVALGDRLGAVEGYMTGSTALVFRRDHDRALALLDEAIAFARDHEYATWRLYMEVLRAQVCFETGQWDATAAQLEHVLTGMQTHGWPRASALVVRGRLRARRGDPGAAEDLATAWAMAHEFDVVQLRFTSAAALAELAWLDDRLDAPPPELAEIADSPDVAAWPAVRGEVGLWMARAGTPPTEVASMAGPHRALVEGRFDDASLAWARLGCVYETAEAAVLSDDTDRVLRGLRALDGLGAVPLAARTRARLRDLGIAPPRGPQRATRSHPAGLTARQAEVLELVVEGATNAEIAERLVVSVRTVDHHVSAILQKLGVASRQEAAEVARTLDE